MNWRPITEYEPAMGAVDVWLSCGGEGFRSPDAVKRQQVWMGREVSARPRPLETKDWRITHFLRITPPTAGESK